MVPKMYAGHLMVITIVVLTVTEILSSCPECTYYEFDHTPGDYTHENKYLKGFILASLYVPGLDNCFVSCIYDYCHCASINYKTSPEGNGTFLCELNYEANKSANASSLVAKDKFLYVDIMAKNSSKVSASSTSSKFRQEEEL